MPNSASSSLQVLVLSPDPVAAAFLGMLVELARYTPAFAHDGEQPEEAMARVRPLAVVLLDDALDATHSDLFFATAARARVSLAIFGTSRTMQPVVPRAAARGVPVFTLPSSLAEMERLLAQARATRWWSRSAERRRAPNTPHVEPGADGTLVYHDRQGRRWSVYDRRGGDRRHAQAGADMERVFVSDSGEVRTYALAAGEAGAQRADDLEAQLARAVPTSP